MSGGWWRRISHHLRRRIDGGHGSVARNRGWRTVVEGCLGTKPRPRLSEILIEGLEVLRVVAVHRRLSDEVLDRG